MSIKSIIKCQRDDLNWYKENKIDLLLHRQILTDKITNLPKSIKKYYLKTGDIILNNCGY